MWTWRFAASCAALLLILPLRAFAEAVLVPSELQAALLAKLVGYDRSFEARAHGQVLVLIAVRPRSPESATAATTLKSALSHIERVGNLPHRELVVTYDGAQALAAQCRDQHAAVVYVTPGFDDQIDALRAALDGVDVLSVSAVSEYVSRGVVIGFELASGKPKLVLNLAQARRQNVHFSGDAMSLMKVYR